nr:hypothetical protein [Curtobacterium sp. MCPF17_003]
MNRRKASAWSAAIAPETMKKTYEKKNCFWYPCIHASLAGKYLYPANTTSWTRKATTSTVTWCPRVRRTSQTITGRSRYTCIVTSRKYRWYHEVPVTMPSAAVRTRSGTSPRRVGLSSHAAAT